MVRAVYLAVLLTVAALESHAFHHHEYKVGGMEHEHHKHLRKATNDNVDDRHVGVTTGASEPGNLISSRSIPLKPMGDAEREKQRNRLRRKGLIGEGRHSLLNKKLHQDHQHEDHPYTRHNNENLANLADSYSEDVTEGGFSSSKSASFHINEEEHRKAMEEHSEIPDEVRERHPHADYYLKRRKVSASITGDELTHREMMKEMIKERQHYYPVARPSDSLISAKYWEAFVCSACTVLCREFESAVTPTTVSHHHSALVEDAENNVTDFYRWDSGRNMLLKVEGDRYSRLSKDDVTVRKELKHLYHSFLLNDYDREAYFGAFFDSAIHQRPVMIYEGFMHDHFCVKHKGVCSARGGKGERFGNLNNRFHAELHRREEQLAGSRRYMRDLLEERRLAAELHEEESERKRYKDLSTGEAQPHEYDTRVMYDRDGNVIDPILQYKFPNRYHPGRESHMEQEEIDAILREETNQELARQREEEYKRIGEALGEL